MSEALSATHLLSLLAEGQRLTTDQSRCAIGAMLSGDWAEIEIASFLTALRVRGETVDELVGAALALRERLPEPTHGVRALLDTCGTGGDGTHTFNISTAAAIVAAACGVAVAKHGNRGVSSTCGSADVLAYLGVRIDGPKERVIACLREAGLAFFFAQHWHEAVRHVMPVRRCLRFRTLFNLLGPLCNPAGAQYQLVGACGWDRARQLALCLARLGTQSAIVVAGADGLDEVSLADRTLAVHVRQGHIDEEIWTPASFGLSAAERHVYCVESIEESAAVLRAVLQGKPGPARDIVLANTAAALRAAESEHDLQAGVGLAQQAIDSGNAWNRLNALIQCSQGECRES